MLENAASTGLVFNIQKYSLHDGPGIRTIIFLKGCPLHCLWCSNPEGISPNPQPWLDREACVSCGACAQVCPQGLHVLRSGLTGTPVHELEEHGLCLACGWCVEVCPAAALEISGRLMTVAEVMDVALQDEPFYRTSGGGVTLSGGEVGVQPAFAREVLEACREHGLHAAIETSGCLPWEILESLARRADLTLFDLKHMADAAHRQLTGRSNRGILENFVRLLRTGGEVMARLPLVPGLNDDPQSLTAALHFLEEQAACGGRLLGVEFLPYHAYGAGKYARLGLPYALSGVKPHTPEQLDVIEAIVSATDLPVRIVRSNP
ncbi:MAG: glycyl-radical enzyme activating protein [Solidesulfovibrio sp.]